MAKKEEVWANSSIHHFAPQNWAFEIKKVKLEHNYSRNRYRILKTFKNICLIILVVPIKCCHHIMILAKMLVNNHISIKCHSRQIREIWLKSRQTHILQQSQSNSKKISLSIQQILVPTREKKRRKGEMVERVSSVWTKCEKTWTLSRMRSKIVWSNLWMKKRRLAFFGTSKMELESLKSLSRVGVIGRRLVKRELNWLIIIWSLVKIVALSNQKSNTNFLNQNRADFSSRKKDPRNKKGFNYKNCIKWWSPRKFLCRIKRN